MLEKFVFRSIFGELQLTQISLNFQTSCCNLIIRGLGVKLCVWLFYYFYFERNYDVLKSKSPCILLNKNINFNINETESKMENATHSFRQTNHVIKLVQKLGIKSKTVTRWSLQKKKDSICCNVCFLSERSFFNICVLS